MQSVNDNERQSEILDTLRRIEALLQRIVMHIERKI
jgi:hypothetical protein